MSSYALFLPTHARNKAAVRHSCVSAINAVIENYSPRPWRLGHSLRKEEKLLYEDRKWDKEKYLSFSFVMYLQ